MRRFDPPAHGADITQASRRYGVPHSDWLDLSTGINPRAYPFAEISAEAFRQLPYDDLAARNAAKNYCNASMLPVLAAGSQALIQWLPFVHQRLCAGRRVALPQIGYAEHAFRWQWAGYKIIAYDPREPAQIDALVQRDDIDVLIVINPHNPLGTWTPPLQLLEWHAALANNNGWLIVDEAFIDVAPQYSGASIANLPGLIVLRSLGKFFGLAGARVGYVFCAEEIAECLHTAIGPWAVSGPALAVAAAALNDRGWQQSMRAQLKTLSVVNAELIARTAWAADKKIYRNALFTTIELQPEYALAIEEQLARRAIRVRRIEVDSEISLLRFGLVDTENKECWTRFGLLLAN